MQLLICDWYIVLIVYLIFKGLVDNQLSLHPATLKNIPHPHIHLTAVIELVQTTNQVQIK